jgi:hypothetical protein
MGHRARPAPRRFIVALLGVVCISHAVAASGADPQLAVIAREARQVISVIDGFYAQHHACPQSSRPEELAELQAELGDGYSVDPQGQFVAIRGISMALPWLYYTSSSHPDACTLWRKLGWDPALIWRRHRGGAKWMYIPGDGRDEIPVKFTP